MMISDRETGQGSSIYSTDLLAFYADSVTTCFSHEPDKLCVPIGLSSLSAVLLLLSCLVLVFQRCKCTGGDQGETIIFFYCFLGNLCSTVGAILSNQLYIQILMGALAALMDAVNCMSCCLPVFLCWNSKRVRRQRMLHRRRRQQLLAICILMVVAGGFLKSRVSHHTADRPPIGRTLLNFIPQDNTEILGYTLGVISFVIACTSRFPAACRAFRGQMLTRASMFSALLCLLAGALYAAAILLCDTRFKFLLRVMPWLLSAICCVILDLLKKNVQKMTEMGHYMDISIHPARKICLKEVTLSKEEAKDQPINRTVRTVRVDSFCLSDTSCDSSLVSSDLEWDFEEAHGHWREPTTIQQQRDKFPLQEWTGNPSPLNVCTCAMSGLSQKTVW
ncbi:hypothetical protein INR49_021423 [Caranx melampygus]|nr:hypothetical protein INR49_021423 [Caranx melampygus]